MTRSTVHTHTQPLQVVLGIDEPLAQHYIMEGSNYSEQMREALKPGVTRIGFPFFMNEEAQDFVIEAVIMTAREGWKLLPQVMEGQRQAGRTAALCTLLSPPVCVHTRNWLIS